MRCLRSLLSGLAVLCSLLAGAQTVVRGRVVEERTLEPLAFVNVSLVGEREGAMTDIDGRFTLTVPSLPVTLRLSYVGYRTVDAEVNDGAAGLIKLARATIELREFEVLPGENPAHRIKTRFRLRSQPLSRRCVILKPGVRGGHHPLPARMQRCILHRAGARSPI